VHGRRPGSRQGPGLRRARSVSLCACYGVVLTLSLSWHGAQNFDSTWQVKH